MEIYLHDMNLLDKLNFQMAVLLNFYRYRFQFNSKISKEIEPATLQNDNNCHKIIHNS